MVQEPKQGELFPEVHAPHGAAVINARCMVRTRAAHRVVIVAGVVIAQYALGDRMAEAYAMVSLIDQGWAEQKEIARAFGCSARSVRRHQRRFEDGGLPALGRSGGYHRRSAFSPDSRLQTTCRSLSRWVAAVCLCVFRAHPTRPRNAAVPAVGGSGLQTTLPRRLDPPRHTNVTKK